MTETKASTSPRRRNVFAILAISAAVVIYLATQLGALLTLDDWSWDAFRLFGAGDQLSYLAVTANVSEGEYAAVEPFTQTGSIYYPHAYYAFLGIVAQVFGLSPAAAWAITGIVVQVVLVVVLGVACILSSGKPWTGVLAAGPFLLGVFATYRTDAWFMPLDSHAVLWGPFAVLFPLNGEAFGLCVGSAAITILILAASRFRDRRARIVIAIAASAAIGALANVQTYSFLTAVYLVSFAVAAYGLVTARKWWLWTISALLLPALFVFGPRVAEGASPLVALMTGLAPAIPGIIYLIVRSRGLAAVYFVVAGLAASPSVVGTYLGLVNRDPFLVYRVASSKDLGVPLSAGTIGAIAVAIPLILVLAAGIHQRNRLWTAYPIGVGVAWFLLAANDRWGANQEPYRMWIDCFMLVATTLLPLMLSVARRYLTRAAEPDPVALPLSEETPHDEPATPVGRRARLLAIGGISVVFIVAVLSAADWGRFFVANLGTQMITLDSPRQLTIADAVESREDDDSLVFVDPCIDPLYVKATTGAPIAWINFGMAWPEHYEAVLGVIGARAADDLDLSAAASADIRWLVTDSTCDSDWAERYAENLELVVEIDAPDGATISLWRLAT
jgi:hypothetical protein